MSYVNVLETPNAPPPRHKTWCVVFTSDRGEPYVACWRNDMDRDGGFATVEKTKWFTSYNFLPNVILWKPIDLPVIPGPVRGEIVNMTGSRL